VRSRVPCSGCGFPRSEEGERSGGFLMALFSDLFQQTQVVWV
jgi:hypothetical protein